MAAWKVVGGGETGGLLCRTGQALSSSELSKRLATGSTVKELQLVGKRLNFELVEGSGPPTGWISTEVKGKQMVVKAGDSGSLVDDDVFLTPLDAPPDLDLGPITPPADRPFDIVIYGATGFTGQLAVQHMDALLGKPGAEKRSWAIAGRNEGSLKKLKTICKTDVQIIVAQTESEVHDMVGKCRVIVSCVGPHARWGEPVIRACVAHGTHYTDSLGECWWLKRMIARYDSEARKRGVMLVSLCGQQAAVADIGVRMLVEKLGPIKQVKGYVVQFAFTTGGTDHNSRYLMKVLEKYPEIYPDLVDPFVIGGLRRGEVRPVDQDCAAAEKDDIYDKLWLGALGCAGTDTRCVRRSCHLFEDGREGRELRYGDDIALIWRDIAMSKAPAERSCQQFGPPPSAGIASDAYKFLRSSLENGEVPPRGAGTPAEIREKNWVQYFMVAEGENGEWATCHFRGGEPYEATSMTTTVGALVLLEEQDRVRPAEFGGLTTPAFAFAGTTFVERLERDRWALHPKGASLKWELRDGRPERAEMMSVLTEKTKAHVEVTRNAAQGGTKLFGLPDYAK